MTPRSEHSLVGADIGGAGAADYTVRKHAVMKSFRKGLLPMLAVMLLVSWLLLREPDFGALVVIAVTAFGILFLGGMNGRPVSSV